MDCVPKIKFCTEVFFSTVNGVPGCKNVRTQWIQKSGNPSLALSFTVEAFRKWWCH